MSVFFAVGFGVGVGLVAAFCFGQKKKQEKNGIKEDGYDERQVAVRGKCYQAAFFTIFFSEVALSMVEAILEAPTFLQGSVPHMLLVFAGATVFACSAIINDAYFRPSDSSRGLVIVFSAVGLFNLIVAVKRIIDGDILNEAGRLDSTWYSLGAAIFLLMVAGTIIIKKAGDKKADEAEGDDE